MLTFCRFSIDIQNDWFGIQISVQYNPSGPMYNTSALVEVMAWCRSGPVHVTGSELIIALPANVHIPRWNISRPWWCHQMETFAALLAIGAEHSPVTGEFPFQRPVTRSFNVRMNRRLSKQSRRWWFEMPSRSLWRHCNVQYWLRKHKSNRVFLKLFC